MEVKGAGDDAWLTAQSHQVSRCLGRYRLVLVTNLHDFMLVDEDGSGGPAKLETFRLAENTDDFRSRLDRPRTFAREVGGGNMTDTHFAVTAGWGHRGAGDAVRPGKGRAVERAYTPTERSALSDALPVLGETTFDVHLNGEAFWRNIPAAVWDYRLGGYQVLKKWQSYREESIIGRKLHPEEVQHFADTARRIGALLMVSRSSVQ